MDEFELAPCPIERRDAGEERPRLAEGSAYFAGGGWRTRRAAGEDGNYAAHG